ncbi:MAG: phosphonate C-P lyase system protein PhnG [Hyphomicrobium sp.]|nr:phosphonate C-P lyase system protein PhnG [Hyphomicrobium sp.]
MTTPIPPRSLWMRAFAAAESDRVLALAGRLAIEHGATHRSAPRAGLALLRLRESVMLDTFYLGEIPVTTARVALLGRDGLHVEGGAVVMDDDVEFAAALAVLDGVLAHGLAGAAEARELLDEGLAQIERVANVRAAMLSRTKVDFSLMAEAGDDNRA